MKSKSKPWKCSQCDKSFKYQSEKSRHEQSHIPQFECKVCKKKFSFVSAVRRHEKQHERSGSVQCIQCGGSFRDETLLKRHMQYAHKGTFTCRKCTAVFNSDSALCSHMKSHRPASERRYHCTFPGCNKAFNFSHHLKHHEMTHTNDKQHFCKECGKGFIQLHHLKVHQKSHAPVNWLPCLVPECKKRFANEYARKRHLATHKVKLDTGETSESNEYSTGKVICVSCDKYITKQNYDKHISKCTNMKNNENNNESAETNINGKENNTVDFNKGDFPLFTTVKDKIEIARADSEIQNETDYTCKTVLGGCLVNGSSDTDVGCICAQMPVDETNVPEVVENIPTNNIIAKTKDTKVNTVKNNSEVVDVTRNTPSCERTTLSGCECYNTHENILGQDDTPEIEYNVNGTVKINITNDLALDQEYTCKTVLGGCLVKGSSDAEESCLCAQMPVHEIPVSESIEDNLITDNIAKTGDVESVEDNLITDDIAKTGDVKKVSVKIDLDDVDVTRNTPSCARTTCSGCECYNTCENRIEQDEPPEVEYNSNGTIKINPTADFAVIQDTNKAKKLAAKENNALLSNCKDVLGNCIVSGDGTMGEGCLCAKMAMYDRQVIEQQIEEITPCPQSTWIS